MKKVCRFHFGSGDGIPFNMKNLALISLAFVLLSCQKIEEAPPDLGPAVSAVAIQEEFRRVEKEIDPFAAKPGDAIGLIMNVMVENPGNLQTLAVLNRIVTEKIESEESVVFKIRNQDFEVENDVAKEVRNEICTMTLTNQISYSCPSWNEEDEDESEEETIHTSPKAYLAAQYLNQVLNKRNPTVSDTDTPVERRYYGLKTAKETASPPQVVRERENCSGLSPCSIRLHHIQYDELEIYADGRTRRKRWDYAMTPDLRYLGTEGIEYQTCLTESIDYNNRPVLLKQCLFVYDLIKTP